MGLLEPITHSEEISGLLEGAKSVYEGAKDRMESQKQSTVNSLETLGKVKLDSWSKEMDSFVNAFEAFHNVEMVRKMDTQITFRGLDTEPNELLVNIESGSFTANEIVKAGVATIGTGALLGIASYGGAMMFGTASTGTAIAALSGAAKANATLAWFGGGSLASGGLGMAAGKFVLGGIALAPVLIVGGIIAGVRGKERLAEAKKINAEAQSAAAQMNVVSDRMESIQNMADDYRFFIKGYSGTFQKYIREINRIKEKYASTGDVIDFEQLSAAEQKMIHVSWLLAQIYYKVLCTPILTQEGTISGEAAATISNSRANISNLRKEMERFGKENAEISNFLWRDEMKRKLRINAIMAAFYIALGIVIFKYSLYLALTCFSAAIIVVPITKKLKEWPANKLISMFNVKLICSFIPFIVLLVLAARNW